jgi:hypothetical protein
LTGTVTGILIKIRSNGISFNGSSTVVGIDSISAENESGTNTYASAASSPDYFPFGLINFKLIMDQPGDQAEITIYFSEPAPLDGRWFKYDPIEATWTDYSTQTSFREDRLSIRPESAFRLHRSDPALAAEELPKASPALSPPLLHRAG